VDVDARGAILAQIMRFPESFLNLLKKMIHDLKQKQREDTRALFDEVKNQSHYYLRVNNLWITCAETGLSRMRGIICRAVI